MTDAIFHSPAPINEPVLSHAPGTKERELLLAEYDRMAKQKRELPMWIGGKAVTTNDRRPVRPPHELKRIIGYSHHGTQAHVKAAINAARTLLYFGGNAEDVTSRLSHPELFEGWNLILVDYRGYGQSQGRATQASLEKDALAWAQAAAGNVPEVPLPRPTQLAVMGTSLGSYYASFVATHQKVDRLILATPYDTIVSVAQGHYPWIPVKWLLRHPHNTLGLVEKIRVPTLFIAAEKDTTVPVLHAQRLHQAWRGPERVWLQVPNVNHNEVTDTPAYREAVQKFLNNSF